jgi:nucleotide-binding universal stress UspA family protein
MSDKNGRGGRIVVGVDGSPSSIEALCWAVRQARLTGGALEAVTAWSYPTSYGFPVIADVDWEQGARTRLGEALDAAVGSDADVARRVIEGHAARVLVEASGGADLLVVGSRGHGGFTGLLLGSVGEHVVTHAPCPVVVVRHPAAAPKG